MPQSNYQEPIEKEDLDLKKKLMEGGNAVGPEIKKSEEQVEEPVPEMPSAEKAPPVEREAAKDEKETQISEKIETARKTIQTQKPATAAANVQEDARVVAGIAEYEKKVEKLVQIALEKGPVHAIKVAQHLDTGDNYTLDELHDKMIEDDLRKQLIQKGLLKEL